MRWMKWLVSIAGVSYLLSGFYLISADEVGVKRRFGEVVNARVNPGLHYRLPYPVEKVDRLKAQEKKRISVGFEFADQATGRASIPTQGEFFTGDNNIMKMEMVLQYSILEPVTFLFSAREPSGLIRNFAKSSLTRTVARMEVDEVFKGSGKLAIQNAVLEETQRQLNSLMGGKRWVQLSSINLQNVFPPLEVADAFKDVIAARQDRDRYINEAEGYRHENIPKARGEAEKLLHEAEAYKAEKVNVALGEAQRFSDMYREFKENKKATSYRLFLESMEKTMPKVQKVVLGKDSEKKPLDLKIINLEE
ncbi:MAG: FtsH protease activity modulator HflK [bacterium]